MEDKYKREEKKKNNKHIFVLGSRLSVAATHTHTGIATEKECGANPPWYVHMQYEFGAPPPQSHARFHSTANVSFRSHTK